MSDAALKSGGSSDSPFLLPESNRPLVISLCDISSAMVLPWVEAGYDALTVDPQHGVTHQDGRITKFAGTIEDAMAIISWAFRNRVIAMVFGFPPCTNLSLSGTRWFVRKKTDKSWEHYQGPNMHFDACRVAWQCENVGQLSGAPWMVENPKSMLTTFWRKPDHKFHPWHFNALAPEDTYTKDTWLWTGNGFVMPEMDHDPSLGEPDDRIHKMPPGKERANIRSKTPTGFALAVFAANHKPALELAA